MSDQIIADYDRVGSWREDYEERIEREFQRRKREAAKEREPVEQCKREARKAEAEAAAQGFLYSSTRKRPTALTLPHMAGM
jgi:hypothetical protein